MELAWNSRRSPVYSLHGMVACTQPLAAEVGLEILKKGGNAADAAVGVAAALNVTQPTSTGIGGDCFALYFDAETKKVKGLNASGRASQNLSLEWFHSNGYNEQNKPKPTDPIWVTVPGAAAGWVDTVEKFGSQTLSLQEILQPSIQLAENGFPVSPICAHDWEKSEQLLKNSSPSGGEMLLDGFAPKEGEIMKNLMLAQTLRELGLHGKQGFYEGRVAKAIVQVVTDLGGLLSEEDLKRHYNTMDTPVHINYRGIDVYEIPPNGQGITALEALNILEGFDLSNVIHNSASHLHLVIESLRLAFSDAHHYICDPNFSKIPVNGLLSKEYAKTRRHLINGQQAMPEVKHGIPPNACSTVYFCVVDGKGNGCSFINSNYMGFGTGIVPQGCGFTLHNRGDNFSLNPYSGNCIEPNKRPYHTIIPGMALREGELYCAFGVMGGFMQPQGHLQVISNMVDFAMNPQQALDAPRVQIEGGKGAILLEDGISPETRDALKAMGHKKPEIVLGWDRNTFGCGQIIQRNPVTKVLCGGSDPRHDGHVIGY